MGQQLRIPMARLSIVLGCASWGTTLRQPGKDRLETLSLYFTLIEICLGLLSSRLGSRTVRTPLSICASIFSTSTVPGSVKALSYFDESGAGSSGCFFVDPSGRFNKKRDIPSVASIWAGYPFQSFHRIQLLIDLDGNSSCKGLARFGIIP